MKKIGHTTIEIHPTMTLSLTNGMSFPKDKYQVDGRTVIGTRDDGTVISHHWTKGQAYKSIEAAQLAAEKAFGYELKWENTDGIDSGLFLRATVATPPTHITRWATRLGKK